MNRKSTKGQSDQIQPTTKNQLPLETTNETMENVNTKTKEEIDEDQKRYDESIRQRFDDLPHQNDSGFQPKPNERNCYHVELVKSKFDTKTGKDNSIRHIQKFEKEEWTNFEKNKERLGFDTVNILWNPNNQ